MKHRYSLLICALLLLLGWGRVPLSAQTKIDITEPGSLASKLGAATSLSSLVISGQLNADDFGALRQTVGIETLDLSEVKVVAGGSYEGNPQMSQPVTTTPGVMPGYFLFSGELANSLTSITLPKSVSRLDVRCLQNGRLLTEINLPDGLTFLGEMAFGYCESLRSIELPETIDTLRGATFEGCKLLAEVELPDVNYMGGSVFDGCESLSSVALPATLRELPFATFKKCTSLEEVRLPKQLQSIGAFAFEGCASLTDISLPPLLRIIEHDAFAGCESLESVGVQSQALEMVGDKAFFNCKALEKIILPAGVTKIGGLAFSGCETLSLVVLPAKLKTIMGGAFSRTAITKVTIPSGCEEILYGAFANCTALEEVVLPHALRKLSDKAFGGCEALKTVLAINPVPVIAEQPGDLAGLTDISTKDNLMLVVPEGTKGTYASTPLWKEFAHIVEMQKLTVEGTVADPIAKVITSLRDPGLYRSAKLSGVITADDMGALGRLTRMQELDLGEVSYEAAANPLDGFRFKDYPQLRNLTFPKKLTTIPAYSCIQSLLLEEVILPEGLETIGEEAFSNCVSLRKIALPQTTLNLESSAFYGCASLTELTLPDNLELIPDYGFFDCVSLQEVKLLNKVTDIGEQAFTNCSHLKKIWLGTSVNEIKDLAFYGCDALESIVVLREEPPAITEDAFTAQHFENVLVVVASKEIEQAYQAAEVWREFKHYKVDPTIVTEIENPRTSDGPDTAIVYGSLGCLRLGLPAAESRVSVYTTSGIQILTCCLPIGTYEFPLAAGLYIVTVNQANYKVYVH